MHVDSIIHGKLLHVNCEISKVSFGLLLDMVHKNSCFVILITTNANH